MGTWQTRLEHGFGSLATFTCKRPLVTLLIMLVFAALCAHRLPDIRIDTSTEGFLADDDPALVAFEKSRDVFGRSEVILMTIETREVFTKTVLEKLSKLHYDLEEDVPFLETLTSLVNARFTRDEDDALIVEELMADLPENDEALRALRDKAIHHPLYRNLILSADGKITTIVLQPVHYEPAEEGADEAQPKTRLSEENLQVFAEAIQTVADRYESLGFHIRLGGTPIITDGVKNAMQSDMKTFIQATILIIAFLLFLLFRRISGVILPIIVLVISMLSTLGILAAAGQPIQIPMMILPSFLLAVAVGDSVHLLAIFYRAFDETGDKEASLISAVEHCGVPVLLTSLTTSAGLLSFAGAEIVPVANLGIFSAVGVMLAFLYTVTILPALLRLLPLRARAVAAKGDANERGLGIVLDWFSRVSTTHPTKIVVIAIMLMAGSLVLASGLEFSHNPLAWLPKDMEAREATETIDARMGGSISVDVIVDSGKDGGLYDPGLLRSLDELMTEFGGFDDGTVKVAKVMGLPTLIKEINQALHDNEPGAYQIPETRELVAQEILLFETSDSSDLERMVDFNYRSTKLTLTIPWIDALLYRGLVAKVTSRFEEVLGDRAKVTVTGMLPILGSTLNGLIQAAAHSYMIAFGVISLMMILLLGSIRLGLLSVVPNLLPIIMVMGLMELLAIPLDMFTMLVASIAIGITVDDTIHFMYNFRRAHVASGNAVDAVFETLRVAGRALLVTTVVLTCGFLIFTLSEMGNLWGFGTMIAATVTLALLADFLVAPALMVLVYGRNP